MTDERLYEHSPEHDDTRGITVTETRAEPTTADHASGVEVARDRFGGVDLPASIAGMLVALASMLLLAGLVSAAIGAIAFQTGVTANEEEISVGALIAAGVVIFLAFLFGGWSAGRMARYSGALNGFMVAVWFLALLVVLAGLGAIAGDSYDLFGELQVAKASLPNWFSADDATTGAIVSSIAFALLMVAGAIVGGLWGTRMHRQADRTIAATRSEASLHRTDTRVQRSDA
jgi:MFS family permease